jgi:hypothetical protein
MSSISFLAALNCSELLYPNFYSNHRPLDPSNPEDDSNDFEDEPYREEDILLIKVVFVICRTGAL